MFRKTIFLLSNHIIFKKIFLVFFNNLQDNPKTFNKQLKKKYNLGCKKCIGTKHFFPFALVKKYTRVLDFFIFFAI